MSGIHSSSLSHDRLQILSTLSVDDMISVVYLLDYQPHADLFVVEALIKAENKTESEGLFNQHILLVNNNRDCFLELLYEILELIQNRRVIRLLFPEGKSPIDASRISPVKKHLYILADKLNENQTCELISRVDKVPVSHCRYFEEVLLRWQTKGIINIGPDWDSTLLSSIEDYAPPCWRRNKVAQATKDEDDHQKLGDFYPIQDPNDMGLCIVINNSEFTTNAELPHLMPEHQLPARPGSEKDVETVCDTFRWLKFNVNPHENVTYLKLKQLLEHYGKAALPSNSALVLVFMSHGMEGIVYTSDSVPIKVDSLEMSFQRDRCPVLAGKPKIFIVQACQGVDLQSVMTDSNVENKPRSNQLDLFGPERADAVIAWSTVKGYASFRDKFEGAWFIQELCRELRAFAHSKDFVEIVTAVNSNLRKKSYYGLTMVPSLTSSLCRKVKFLSQCSST